MASSISRTTCLRTVVRPSHVAKTHSVRSLSSISGHVPPEAPDFVDVPQPPQQRARNPPIVKGILPVPKTLFRPDSKTGRPKHLESHLARTSREPSTARPIPQGKDKEFVEYKARLTEMRRRSIRHGLTELKKREEKAIRTMAWKSREKQEINRRNLRRPERPDDLYTSPTVLPTIENLVSAPLTEREIADKRARFEAKEWAKAEERRNNLHTLYMNARDFIVTETQLNAAIDKVFDMKNLPENDPSIWAKEGVPENVQTIIARQSGVPSYNAADISVNEGYTMVTKDRLQAIAEELTGGKMESQDRIDQRAGKRRIA